MAAGEDGVLVVGGGLAAVRTAAALREAGYAGPIRMRSDEPQFPYDRPPLSKGYLLGKVGEERIRLADGEQFARLGVDFKGGIAATGLDRDQRRVRFADASVLAYSQLVVATGARPNRLAAFDGFDNVHVLRSRSDADRLRQAIGPGRSLCIAGAGFIGLEIASTAIELGCRVTLVETAATPLAAILGHELGARMQRWHEGKGAMFRCAARIVRVHGDGEGTGARAGVGCVARSIELADGSRVVADAFVVGVGQSASVGWLEGSGLELDRGLVCDEHGRSADPRVFAVGDAACIESGGRRRPTRHWTATTEQARRVAAAIAGMPDDEPVVEDNYFWSDQYGLRLQFAGTVPAEPRLVPVAGGQSDERFAVLCCSDGEITAVFSVGCVRDFLTHSMPLRRGERVAAP